MKLLVTGCSGFIGRFLCEQLLANGHSVRGTLLPTEAQSTIADRVEPTVVQPLGLTSDWCQALEDIETVIHLAARVHIMDDPSADPLTEFRKVNVEGTARLAQEAAKAGVKRLVFISSIKVNGEENVAAYTPDSPPNPTDPYGISKWEAEQALRKVEAETGLEVVIIRPTLVYGPGVKANFFTMLNTINKGIPLPFASIQNKRSLIYVGNLVDALATCATHHKAAGQTYLVSDGVDVSTPELIRRTASALGVSARLLHCPVTLMKLTGKLSGKSGTVNRLTGSLMVDSSKIRNELGWKPPFSMEEGLRETARWYKEDRKQFWG